MSTPDSAADLAEKVLAECRKYGLETMVDGDPTDLFDVLMRHLYANHEVTLAVQNKHIEMLAERIAAVVKLHTRRAEPRHGCCAAPKLCNGHVPECEAKEHGMAKPSWPCPTLRALGVDSVADAERLTRAEGTRSE